MADLNTAEPLSLEAVCGRCGAVHTREAFRRAQQCPSCGRWREWTQAAYGRTKQEREAAKGRKKARSRRPRSLVAVAA